MAQIQWNFISSSCSSLRSSLVGVSPPLGDSRTQVPYMWKLYQLLEPCLHQWKRRGVWSSYTYSLNYWLEISYRTTPNLKRGLWMWFSECAQLQPYYDTRKWNLEDIAISDSSGICCLCCLLPELCSTISEAHVGSPIGKRLIVLGCSYFMEEKRPLIP